jgi:hypothetical protein
VAEIRGRLQLRKVEPEAFLLAPLVVAVSTVQLQKPSGTIIFRAEVLAGAEEAGELAPNGVALFPLALLGRRTAAQRRPRFLHQPLTLDFALQHCMNSRLHFPLTRFLSSANGLSSPSRHETP